MYAFPSRAWEREKWPDMGGSEQNKITNDTDVSLDASVTVLAGVGPKRAEQLAGLGIVTVEDLLLHLPRGYEDRRNFATMGTVEVGAEVCIRGEVVSSRNQRMRGRQNMAVLKVRDETGEMTVTFFGRGFMAKTVFAPGKTGVFFGKVEKYQGMALKNPEYEMLAGDAEDALHVGRIVPIYGLTEGVSQRFLRKLIMDALDRVTGVVGEVVPESLRTRVGWSNRDGAMRMLHYPETLEEAQGARAQFAYEELLLLQLGILIQRQVEASRGAGIVHMVNGPLLVGLHGQLPFSLTEGQERVISTVLADMASAGSMIRLVQGDVGCGKTVVALHAIAAALDGGYQVAMMVPTEILAEQHGVNLAGYLAPLGVEVAVLTSRRGDAKGVRTGLASGTVRVVVGTQALIQAGTVFGNLGLVVVDEQHRFGVEQRAKLVSKGHYPDVLQMTATPIPRTLAITVYGGMDVSVVRGMPPGRLPVKTRQIPEGKLDDLYVYLREQVDAGQQVYMVCPVIEMNEESVLRSVEEHFEELSTGALHGVSTALLHGRMEPEDKAAVMSAFKAGDVAVLFSTTVIEVGVDVPAATIMVIENADQFGLTQLHQLRGRVGRGGEQAYCFLLGQARTDEGQARLDTLCTHTDGFRIAEEDLLQRGPGEFYGAKQAGLSDLRVADLIRDAAVLEEARRDAGLILSADPGLKAKHHRGLRGRMVGMGRVRH